MCLLPSPILLTLVRDVPADHEHSSVPSPLPENLLYAYLCSFMGITLPTEQSGMDLIGGEWLLPHSITLDNPRFPGAALSKDVLEQL